MKFKKILSFIIVLSMIMSILSIGVVFASAAEVDGALEKIAAEEVDISNISATSWDEFVWWYSLNSNFSYQVTSEEFSSYKTLLEEHFIDSEDYFFFPASIIATQPVSGGGKLIVLLCFTGNSPEKIDYDELGMDDIEKHYHLRRSYWYTIFTIYEDAAGKKKVVNSTQIDPERLKTVDKNAEGVNSSWSITENKNGIINNFEAHEAAFKNYKDIVLDNLAYIGVESKGYERTGNYRVLCLGTVNSKTNLYIVEFYEDEGEEDNEDDNKVEIKNVSLFDLNEYAGFKEGEETKSNTSVDSNANTNTKNNDSEIKINDNSATNDSAGKSYDNTNNANGSIATGQSSIATTVALLLVVMIPAVLFFIRKRKNG